MSDANRAQYPERAGRRADPAERHQSGRARLIPARGFCRSALTLHRPRGSRWRSGNTATMTRSVLPISSGRSMSAPANCWTRPSPAPPRSTREINAVVVKHYDYAQAPDRQGSSGRPLHRRAVPAQGSGDARGHADDVRRERLQGQCCRSYRHPRPAFSRCRCHHFRQKLHAGIRIDADHRVPSVRTDAKSMESLALLRRFVRRRGCRGRRAHSSRRACQRRRRLDPDSGLGVRRVRIEADPRAQRRSVPIAARAGPDFPAAMC